VRPMSVRVVHQSGVPLTSPKIKTRWLPSERRASRQFGFVSPRNQHTTNGDTTRDGGDGGRRRAFVLTSRNSGGGRRRQRALLFSRAVPCGERDNLHKSIHSTSAHCFQS